MHPVISIGVALTAIGTIGLILSWTRSRNERRIRLDRGLRGYISNFQR